MALSVCTQYKAFLGMAFAPAQAAYAVGLRTDCMTLDACASATSLPIPLAPGTKTLFIEGYGAEDGAVTLSFARPTALTPATDCCTAQQDAEDMGPLTPSMTLTAQSVGNGVTGLGPSCAPDTESTSITALKLSEPVQLTVVAPPVVGKTVGYFGLREDCNADGTDLTCKQGPGLFTTAAGPGLYYLTAQHNTFDGTVFANIFVEPPVTPTSNLACASAAQLLLNQAFHEERIVGGTPDPNLPGRFLRFYSFTTSAPDNLVFQLIGWTGAGNATYSIRINCADPASELASGQISGTQSWSSFLPGLPAGVTAHTA